MCLPCVVVNKECQCDVVDLIAKLRISLSKQADGMEQAMIGNQSCYIVWTLPQLEWLTEVNVVDEIEGD
jgi:hypothetical protein